MASVHEASCFLSRITASNRDPPFSFAFVRDSGRNYPTVTLLVRVKERHGTQSIESLSNFTPSEACARTEIDPLRARGKFAIHPSTIDNALQVAHRVAHERRVRDCLLVGICPGAQSRHFPYR
uniref:Uncharacterized protein n=1 Tax=Candidatus Kentrum sp. LFY TaxID=2126342 RepID=A0A450UH10_9GAMM|nr:MAG: hypothetical protein BECKLFY1418A_GA0070994_101834 [Candidatus Kentron sp. LFY]